MEVFEKLTTLADDMGMPIGEFEQSATTFKRKPPHDNVRVQIMDTKLIFFARGTYKEPLREFFNEPVNSNDPIRLRRAIRAMAIREP